MRKNFFLSAFLIALITAICGMSALAQSAPDYYYKYTIKKGGDGGVILVLNDTAAYPQTAMALADIPPDLRAQVTQIILPAGVLLNTGEPVAANGTGISGGTIGATVDIDSVALVFPKLISVITQNVTGVGSEPTQNAPQYVPGIADANGVNLDPTDNKKYTWYPEKGVLTIYVNSLQNANEIHSSLGVLIPKYVLKATTKLVVIYDSDAKGGNKKTGYDAYFPGYFNQTAWCDEFLNAINFTTPLLTSAELPDIKGFADYVTGPNAMTNGGAFTFPPAGGVAGKIKEIIAPNAEYIATNTFLDMTALTYVSFPKVTYIGEDAFVGTNLSIATRFPSLLWADTVTNSNKYSAFVGTSIEDHYVNIAGREAASYSDAAFTNPNGDKDIVTGVLVQKGQPYKFTYESGNSGRFPVKVQYALSNTAPDGGTVWADAEGPDNYGVYTVPANKTNGERIWFRGYTSLQLEMDKVEYVSLPYTHLTPLENNVKGEEIFGVILNGNLGNLKLFETDFVANARGYKDGEFTVSLTGATITNVAVRPGQGIDGDTVIVKVNTSGISNDVNKFVLGVEFAASSKYLNATASLPALASYDTVIVTLRPAVEYTITATGTHSYKNNDDGLTYTNVADKRFVFTVKTDAPAGFPGTLTADDFTWAIENSGFAGGVVTAPDLSSVEPIDVAVVKISANEYRVTLTYGDDFDANPADYVSILVTLNGKVGNDKLDAPKTTPLFADYEQYSWLPRFNNMVTVTIADGYSFVQQMVYGGVGSLGNADIAIGLMQGITTGLDAAYKDDWGYIEITGNPLVVKSLTGVADITSKFDVPAEITSGLVSTFSGVPGTGAYELYTLTWAAISPGNYTLEWKPSAITDRWGNHPNDNWLTTRLGVEIDGPITNTTFPDYTAQPNIDGYLPTLDGDYYYPAPFIVTDRATLINVEIVKADGADSVANDMYAQTYNLGSKMYTYKLTFDKALTTPLTTTGTDIDWTNSWLSDAGAFVTPTADPKVWYVTAILDRGTAATADVVEHRINTIYGSGPLDAEYYVTRAAFVGSVDMDLVDGLGNPNDIYISNEVGVTSQVNVKFTWDINVNPRLNVSAGTFAVSAPTFIAGYVTIHTTAFRLDDTTTNNTGVFQIINNNALLSVGDNTKIQARYDNGMIPGIADAWGNSKLTGSSPQQEQAVTGHSLRFTNLPLVSAVYVNDVTGAVAGYSDKDGNVLYTNKANTPFSFAILYTPQINRADGAPVVGNFNATSIGILNTDPVTNTPATGLIEQTSLYIYTPAAAATATEITVGVNTNPLFAMGTASPHQVISFRTDNNVQVVLDSVSICDGTDAFANTLTAATDHRKAPQNINALYFNFIDDKEPFFNNGSVNEGYIAIYPVKDVAVGDTVYFDINAQEVAIPTSPNYPYGFVRVDADVILGNDKDLHANRAYTVDWKGVVITDKWGNELTTLNMLDTITTGSPAVKSIRTASFSKATPPSWLANPVPNDRYEFVNGEYESTITGDNGKVIGCDYSWRTAAQKYATFIVTLAAKPSATLTAADFIAIGSRHAFDYTTGGMYETSPNVEGVFIFNFGGVEFVNDTTYYVTVGFPAQSAEIATSVTLHVNPESTRLTAPTVATPIAEHWRYSVRTEFMKIALPTSAIDFADYNTAMGNTDWTAFAPDAGIPIVFRDDFPFRTPPALTPTSSYTGDKVGGAYGMAVNNLITISPIIGTGTIDSVLVGTMKATNPIYINGFGPLDEYGDSVRAGGGILSNGFNYTFTLNSAAINNFTDVTDAWGNKMSDADLKIITIQAGLPIVTRIGADTASLATNLNWIEDDGVAKTINGLKGGGKRTYYTNGDPGGQNAIDFAIYFDPSTPDADIDNVVNSLRASSIIEVWSDREAAPGTNMDLDNILTDDLYYDATTNITHTPGEKFIKVKVPTYNLWDNHVKITLNTPSAVDVSTRPAMNINGVAFDISVAEGVDTVRFKDEFAPLEIHLIRMSENNFVPHTNYNVPSLTFNYFNGVALKYDTSIVSPANPTAEDTVTAFKNANTLMFTGANRADAYMLYDYDPIIVMGGSSTNFPGEFVAYPAFGRYETDSTTFSYSKLAPNIDYGDTTVNMTAAVWPLVVIVDGMKDIYGNLNTTQIPINGMWKTAKTSLLNVLTAQWSKAVMTHEDSTVNVQFVRAYGATIDTEDGRLADNMNDLPKTLQFIVETSASVDPTQLKAALNLRITHAPSDAKFITDHTSAIAEGRLGSGSLWNVIVPISSTSSLTSTDSVVAITSARFPSVAGFADRYFYTVTIDLTNNTYANTFLAFSDKYGDTALIELVISTDPDIALSPTHPTINNVYNVKRKFNTPYLISFKGIIHVYGAAHSTGYAWGNTGEIPATTPYITVLPVNDNPNDLNLSDDGIRINGTTFGNMDLTLGATGQQWVAMMKIINTSTVAADYNTDTVNYLDAVAGGLDRGDKIPASGAIINLRTPLLTGGTYALVIDSAFIDKWGNISGGDKNYKIFDTVSTGQNGLTFAEAFNYHQNITFQTSKTKIREIVREEYVTSGAPMLVGSTYLDYSTYAHRNSGAPYNYLTKDGGYDTVAFTVHLATPSAKLDITDFNLKYYFTDTTGYFPTSHQGVLKPFLTVPGSGALDGNKLVAFDTANWQPNGLVPGTADTALVYYPFGGTYTGLPAPNATQTKANWLIVNNGPTPTDSVQILVVVPHLANYQNVRIAIEPSTAATHLDGFAYGGQQDTVYNVRRGQNFATIMDPSDDARQEIIDANAWRTIKFYDLDFNEFSWYQSEYGNTGGVAGRPIILVQTGNAIVVADNIPIVPGNAGMSGVHSEEGTFATGGRLNFQIADPLIPGHFYHVAYDPAVIWDLWGNNSTAIGSNILPVNPTWTSRDGEGDTVEVGKFTPAAAKIAKILITTAEGKQLDDNSLPTTTAPIYTDASQKMFKTNATLIHFRVELTTPIDSSSFVNDGKFREEFAIDTASHIGMTAAGDWKIVSDAAGSVTIDTVRAVEETGGYASGAASYKYWVVTANLTGLKTDLGAHDSVLVRLDTATTGTMGFVSGIVNHPHVTDTVYAVRFQSKPVLVKGLVAALNNNMVSAGGLGQLDTTYVNQPTVGTGQILLTFAAATTGETFKISTDGTPTPPITGQPVITNTLGTPIAFQLLDGNTTPTVVSDTTIPGGAATTIRFNFAYTGAETSTNYPINVNLNLITDAYGNSIGRASSEFVNSSGFVGSVYPIYAGIDQIGQINTGTKPSIASIKRLGIRVDGSVNFEAYQVLADTTMYLGADNNPTGAAMNPIKVTYNDNKASDSVAFQVIFSGALLNRTNAIDWFNTVTGWEISDTTINGGTRASVTGTPDTLIVIITPTANPTNTYIQPVYLGINPASTDANIAFETASLAVLNAGAPDVYTTNYQGYLHKAKTVLTGILTKSGTTALSASAYTVPKDGLFTVELHGLGAGEGLNYMSAGTANDSVLIYVANKTTGDRTGYVMAKPGTPPVAVSNYTFTPAPIGGNAIITFNYAGLTPDTAYGVALNVRTAFVDDFGNAIIPQPEIPTADSVTAFSGALGNRGQVIVTPLPMITSVVRVAPIYKWTNNPILKFEVSATELPPGMGSNNMSQYLNVIFTGTDPAAVLPTWTANCDTTNFSTTGKFNVEINLADKINALSATELLEIRQVTIEGKPAMFVQAAKFGAASSLTAPENDLTFQYYQTKYATANELSNIPGGLSITDAPLTGTQRVTILTLAYLDTIQILPGVIKAPAGAFAMNSVFEFGNYVANGVFPGAIGGANVGKLETGTMVGTNTYLISTGTSPVTGDMNIKFDFILPVYSAGGYQFTLDTTAIQDIYGNHLFTNGAVATLTITPANNPVLLSVEFNAVGMATLLGATAWDVNLPVTGPTTGYKVIDPIKGSQGLFLNRSLFGTSYDLTAETRLFDVTADRPFGNTIGGNGSAVFSASLDFVTATSAFTTSATNTTEDASSTAPYIVATIVATGIDADLLLADIAEVKYTLTTANAAWANNPAIATGRNDFISIRNKFFPAFVAAVTTNYDTVEVGGKIVFGTAPAPAPLTVDSAAISGHIKYIMDVDVALLTDNPYLEHIFMPTGIGTMSGTGAVSLTHQTLTYNSSGGLSQIIFEADYTGLPYNATGLSINIDLGLMEDIWGNQANSNAWPTVNINISTIPNPTVLAVKRTNTNTGITGFTNEKVYRFEVELSGEPRDGYTLTEDDIIPILYSPATFVTMGTGTPANPTAGQGTTVPTTNYTVTKSTADGRFYDVVIDLSGVTLSLDTVVVLSFKTANPNTDYISGAGWPGIKPDGLAYENYYYRGAFATGLAKETGSVTSIANATGNGTANITMTPTTSTGILNFTFDDYGSDGATELSYGPGTMPEPPSGLYIEENALKMVVGTYLIENTNIQNTAAMLDSVSGVTMGFSYNFVNARYYDGTAWVNVGSGTSVDMYIDKDKVTDKYGNHPTADIQLNYNITINMPATYSVFSGTTTTTQNTAAFEDHTGAIKYAIVLPDQAPYNTFTSASHPFNLEIRDGSNVLLPIYPTMSVTKYNGNEAITINGNNTAFTNTNHLGYVVYVIEFNVAVPTTGEYKVQLNSTNVNIEQYFTGKKFITTIKP
ncbi:MAG: leucine-rich repeat domain-containing protein [Ignavibacteria bacterium]|jgi:hypothetical protein|nr:leucine-rich repeat domain-containing protein [Ignavibacteria bacterium]